MSGCTYGSGFASGSLSSLTSSGAQYLAGQVQSSVIQGGITTLGGTIAGGIGAELTGGNFWDGARNGAISSGLNHAMHMTIKSDANPPKKGEKSTNVSKKENKPLIPGPYDDSSWQNVKANINTFSRYFKGPHGFYEDASEVIKIISGNAVEYVTYMTRLSFPPITPGFQYIVPPSPVLPQEPIVH